VRFEEFVEFFLKVVLDEKIVDLCKKQIEGRK
jgi:hypothetical protein